MILAYLLLLTGLTISSVAIYYSVVGLTAIFSAAAIPIMIMGVSLEVAKLVCATWIKQYWTQVPRLMKTYMVVAIVILMLITSMGIFGFLSKAHNDQNLVSGDVQSKIAIFDEKITTARSNIEADRKQLTQMDAAVDQVMARSTSETGADKSVAIRNSQKRDRAAIARDIETNQKTIAQLNDEAAPIRAEVRKVEAEVGPIKYIAAFIYGVAPDASMLEKAVTWIIITIVIVFDPLAVIMLLAAQMTFGWHKKPKEDGTAEIETTPKPDSTFVNVEEELEPVFEREEIPDFTDYSEGHIPEPEEELPLVKKKVLWSGFGFPMSGVFGKPKEEVVEFNTQDPETAKDTEIETLPDSASQNPWAMDERPGDYVEPHRQREAAPGRNRGVMYVSPAAQADNAPPIGTASNSGFGNTYPAAANKGDIFVRTDYLPNRLFKYNGNKWIEVDKSRLDLYTYDELYIKHLVDQIADGKYDIDILTDVEREQISIYLGKNAQ